MAKTSFRILSIDGGGLKGVGPAAILNELGDSFIKSCDAFAGTSTGAILAAAYAHGLKTKEVLDFYMGKPAERIFQRSWYNKFNLIGAKWDKTEIKAVLKEVFGDKQLSALSKPVYLCYSDFGGSGNETMKARVFDRETKDMTISKAVRISAAAPTYFPVVDDRYADGGLVANCPTLHAIAGVLREFPHLKLGELEVVSINTNGRTKNGCKIKTSWSLASWIEPILNFGMEGSVEMVDFMVRQLPLKNYWRVCPEIKGYPMDDLSKRKEIRDAWLNAWKNTDIPKFCSTKA